MENNVQDYSFYLTDALKKIKTFKEGKLLEDSWKHISYSILTHELENLYQQDIDNILESAFKGLISKLVYEDIKSDIKSNPTPIGKEFKIDFMLMRPENFREIVNFCVKTMPMEAIERIRNNQ